MNGVKIAVPIAKMSHTDLEYVEKFTGISLDDEKPLADVKRSRPSERKPQAGATVEKNKAPEYDWFQFFLSCEVAVGICERYAQAFSKESMDESVLPDVDATILRNLGLREGDIIKVMRTLDTKFGRNKRNADAAADGEGGLFSGPGGTLRNNTRKGRPAPAVQTSDVVDPAAFSSKKESSAASEETTQPKSPAQASPRVQQAGAGGFDDDAWDIKPNKQQSSPPVAKQTPAPEPAPAAAKAAVPEPTPAPLPPAITGSMKELSLLSQPLQPTRVEPQPTAASTAPVLGQPTGASANFPQQQQLPGASPSFFSSVPQPQLNQQTSPGFVNPQTMLRQRPMPPQMTATQGSLAPPPPQRPLSAPQSAQPSAFPAPTLVPQMTGVLQGQVAPAGQSLNEINQQRMQQQFAAQMQQPAMTGYGQPQGMAPFPGAAQAQFMQPMMTGMPNPSTFGNPSQMNQFAQMQPQQTGFPGAFGASQGPFGQAQAQGPVNSYLPQPLEPQRTGMPPMQPQVTGMSGFNQPSMPLQPLQPLQPQQTGPPPAVRFGVSNEPKKLVPEPTGRRANLAQATPQNPFGF
jgi:hypothetical protein